MLLSFLQQNQIKYECDKSLKEMTSFRIGGLASTVIYPDTIEKTAASVSYLYENNLPYFVMGNGTNLLFSDSRHTIPIIKTDALNFMYQSENKFTFGAGVKLSVAANFAAEKGYSGLEFAHGIPGSIGGAVYMNAGAYDGEMSDVVLETKYIDETGKILTLAENDHQFSYRHSFFTKSKHIILSSTFCLKSGDISEIRSKMAELFDKRKTKQPLNFPSAGSTFKRPEGAYAAALIDECGLRGYSIGGAAVSEKHCGFVVNNNNATFEDVEKLIKFIQATVKEKTGYMLECEVEIVK